MFNQSLSLNCAGKLLDLEDPIVMGILNLTPDSFYKESRYSDEKTILHQVEKMLKAGAKIIDLGGMSSRPGAELISVEEELNRVIPILEKIVIEFPEAVLSIDTVRSEVAKEALDRGAGMINDISAGRIDPDILKLPSVYRVPYVLMHMKELPKTMQEAPIYDDVALEILDFFIQRIEQLRVLDVIDIIIDPGFGFGKTIAHNFELLQRMSVFKMLEVPLMVGISRKSMIYKTIDKTPEEALHGTGAIHMLALKEGAKILRVHDVEEAVEVIQLWKAVSKA